MTQEQSENICEVSISSTDYRYYVKDMSVLDSVITPPSSDVRYKVVPEYLRLWDSVANYRSVFETMPVSPVVNPVVFKPDPYEGDYRNLYKPEDSVGITWDASVYDSVNSMLFPEGMLKPAMPVVQYNVDAYQPSLDLEIPVIPVPQDRTPGRTLPDIIVPDGGGVGEISVECDVCFLSAGIVYSSDSKSATIQIGWANPPSSQGVWVPIIWEGACLWNTVKICHSAASGQSE
jgi:hypothetical protein